MLRHVLPHGVKLRRQCYSFVGVDFSSHNYTVACIRLHQVACCDSTLPASHNTSPPMQRNRCGATALPQSHPAGTSLMLALHPVRLTSQIGPATQHRGNCHCRRCCRCKRCRHHCLQAAADVAWMRDASRTAAHCGSVSATSSLAAAASDQMSA
jgi:hypothetical protein